MNRETIPVLHPERIVEILERTPSVLQALLHGLPEETVRRNEGPGTWSPFDVVGHLIHGEKTDWIPRMEILLSERQDKSFEPFDRFAQLRDNRGKTMNELLDEFRDLRRKNMERLVRFRLSETDLAKTGVHPEFGTVTLAQLLATWAVHDLNHVSQIVRILAGDYKESTGPWMKYLKILQ